MADGHRFYGVNFDNLRKALYLLYFGVDPIKDINGNVIGSYSDDFESPKYKYIIPMQGNFENPLQPDGTMLLDPKDTFMLYWIERDESLTQDDYFVDENNKGWNRQKCVASILIRFVGKNAEDWAKVFRHLVKRDNVTIIWSGVCNAEKLEYTAPIVPRRIDYFGKNSQTAFDVRFKLYYDEVVSTGWQPLEGIDFTFNGNVTP